MYEPENNRYICPAGQFLNYGGRVYRNRAFNYIGTRKKMWPMFAPTTMHQCATPLSQGLGPGRAFAKSANDGSPGRGVLPANHGCSGSGIAMNL